MNVDIMYECVFQLGLPGFRFHPTEEELLDFYLKRMIFGTKLAAPDLIGLLNIYNYDPKDLPAMARVGEREWYFFVPRDGKHGSGGGGGRPNRTTENGFWKATGSDRKIMSSSDPRKVLGLRKTLVFYQGRAPRGTRTDWVMNEYRLIDSSHPRTKELVLCKIYMKATPIKVLEQMAAMEEEFKNPPMDSVSFSNHLEEVSTPTPAGEMGTMEFEEEGECKAVALPEDVNKHWETSRGRSVVLPNGEEKLAELQVPKCNMDWNQDSFWAQIQLSPWLENISPFLKMC